MDTSKAIRGAHIYRLYEFIKLKSLILNKGNKYLAYSKIRMILEKEFETITGDSKTFKNKTFKLAKVNSILKNIDTEIEEVNLIKNTQVETEISVFFQEKGEVFEEIKEMIITIFTTNMKITEDYFRNLLFS